MLSKLHATPSEDVEQLERKRHRNRVAQQKYRKKLKSHILDLERRAAVADQLSKANVHVHAPVNNGTPSSPLFTTERGFPRDYSNIYQPSTKPIQPNDSQAYNAAATAKTETRRNGLAPARKNSHQSRAASEVMLMSSETPEPFLDDAEFLKAFPFPREPWSSPKNPMFHDLENLEMAPYPIDAAVSPPLYIHDRQESSASPHPRDSTRLSTKSNKSTSRTSTGPPSGKLASAAQGELDTEGRINHILQCMQNVGFDSPDSFASCFYNSVLKDKTPAKAAQEMSRCAGLPQLLEGLLDQASSWSTWESGRYRDTIIRSAARLITEELEGLSRKQYTCEVELRQNLSPMSSGDGAADGLNSSISQLHPLAAELKRTLRNELPNLHVLMASLAVDDTPSKSTRTKLLLATMRIMASPSDGLVHEAAGWVHSRRSSV